MRLYKNDHLRAYKVVLGVCNAEELRTYNGNIYREFFIFDDGQSGVVQWLSEEDTENAK